MTNVLLHGCNGRMGNMVSKLAQNYPNIDIVAGVDLEDTDDGGKLYPVYDRLEDVQENVDVVIDVSTSSAVDALLEFLKNGKIAAVICTTGLSEQQIRVIHELSDDIAILRSGNMSMGINTLLHIIKEAAPALMGAGFDAEIVEKHHALKVDAPSGTALMLADAIKEASGNDYEYVYGRSDRREIRPQAEIGISSVRGGTIVGEHEVIFAGTDEIIEIKHTALSRAVFANGMLNAALYLDKQMPGIYSMADVVADN